MAEQIRRYIADADGDLIERADGDLCVWSDHEAALGEATANLSKVSMLLGTEMGKCEAAETRLAALVAENATTAERVREVCADAADQWAMDYVDEDHAPKRVGAVIRSIDLTEATK